MEHFFTPQLTGAVNAVSQAARGILDHVNVGYLIGALCIVLAVRLAHKRMKDAEQR